MSWTIKTPKEVLKKSGIHKAIVLGIVIFLIGVVIGNYFIAPKFGGCDSSNLKYLNPQIVCVEKMIVDKRNYIEFSSRLSEYIKEQKTNNAITDASVYFRDLEYGPTLSLNGYADFAPASLLKLPMLLTYLNLSDDKPNLLKTKLYFQGTNDSLTQSIPPRESIQENVQYSIEDLLNYMIKYSDNKSYYVLLQYLNQISPNTQLLRETFLDLGIVDPTSNYQDTINVKSYASIFTQIFNSSYFDKKETSEKALDLLSNTDFTSGLVAGVPSGITIAHKFGERIDESTGIKQLHDCGIVYYPQNPYLLCVMTRGHDMNKLMIVIAEISKMMYEEFDSRKL